MAIPLLFLVPAAATAVYGLVKGGVAVKDHMNASETNENAQSIVKHARLGVEEHRKATESELENYGSRKLRSFTGVVNDFIETFARLKNVELLQSPELDKLQLGSNSSVVLADLRHDYQALQEAGLGLGAGLGGGAALAFGAYNGTMMLATASTGTAISTLSGAAATNATLAWLGGGSIAAGGGGMAMGTMVLGGIVAGPALAIFGHVLGARAETALAEANSNLERARTHRVEAQKICEQLKIIHSVTRLADKTFSQISLRLRKSVHDLKHEINTHGDNYGNFSTESREVVFRAVKFAQLIKAMIDTPILDESGNLVISTKKRIGEISEAAGIANESKTTNEPNPNYEVVDPAGNHAAILTDSGENKIEVIKILRANTNFTISEAKQLAYGGGEIKTSVSEECAESIKRKLGEVGASVDVIMTLPPRTPTPLV